MMVVSPRLLRFAGVGIASTLCYAVLNLALTALVRVGPVEASFGAYTVATVFSYLAHRNFTFRSNGSHASDAPRFAVLAICGYAVALAVPFFLSRIMGQPPLAATVVTCIAVPAINYVLMARAVFVTTK